MGGEGLSTRYTFSQRYVDTSVERARWRSTANVRVHPRLQLGVEFNAVAEEVGPLVTLFLTTEGPRVPGVFLGTSSDRIGSPPGEQSYYMTLAKSIPELGLATYATVNYSEWDDEINFPFGATLALGRGFSVRPMYDGAETHMLLNYDMPRATISFLWVWLEEPGISVSFGF